MIGYVTFGTNDLARATAFREALSFYAVLQR
jgi:catechol 2,3-dioxygenase-like lactoylglutathione lyase family enzyme